MFLQYLTIVVKWFLVIVSFCHDYRHQDLLVPWNIKDTCVLHIWQVESPYHSGIERDVPEKNQYKVQHESIRCVRVDVQYQSIS